jgi:hypothetical protein
MTRRAPAESGAPRSMKMSTTGTRGATESDMTLSEALHSVVKGSCPGRSITPWDTTNGLAQRPDVRGPRVGSQPAMFRLLKWGSLWHHNDRDIAP